MIVDPARYVREGKGLMVSVPLVVDRLPQDLSNQTIDSGRNLTLVPGGYGWTTSGAEPVRSHYHL